MFTLSILYLLFVYLQDIKAILSSYPRGKEVLEEIQQSKKATPPALKVIKWALVSDLMDKKGKK